MHADRDGKLVDLLLNAAECSVVLVVPVVGLFAEVGGVVVLHLALDDAEILTKLADGRTDAAGDPLDTDAEHSEEENVDDPPGGGLGPHSPGEVGPGVGGDDHCSSTHSTSKDSAVAPVSRLCESPP